LKKHLGLCVCGGQSSDAGAARIDRITVVESRVVDAVWRLKLEGSKHMIAVTNVHTGNETPGNWLDHKSTRPINHCNLKE